MAGRAWPIDAVPATTGDPEYAARHARQTSIAPLAGGATAARPLGARSGVRPGTPAATVAVTATTWTVHQVAGLIDVETATEAGPYGFAFDADQTGSVTAADGTNPRWDGLYVVLDDPAEDESTVPSLRVEYVAGVASATPALPATPPDRSFRLCKIVVPQSGGGSPSVVWDPPYLPHETWLVRSDADRDALASALVPTAEYPLEVLHIGASNTKRGVREVSFDGSAWSSGRSWTFDRTSSGALGSATSFGAGSYVTVATGTVTGALPGTYLAVARVGLFNTGVSAASMQLRKGTTVLAVSRCDTEATINRFYSVSAPLVHTGGDLTVDLQVSVSSGAPTVQNAGSTAIDLVRVG